jgi:hypothetical protein
MLLSIYSRCYCYPVASMLNSSLLHIACCLIELLYNSCPNDQGTMVLVAVPLKLKGHVCTEGEQFAVATCHNLLYFH